MIECQFNELSRIAPYKTIIKNWPMSFKLSVVASNQALYITVYLYIFSEYMCENSHVSLVMQFFQETRNSLKFD
jgi:hypothetical protein